jgi:hypothetical protein
MPIQPQGYSGVVPEVDASFRAMRASLRPLDHGSLGHYRLAMNTTSIGASLAASGELFHFRWTDSTNLAVIQKILVSAGANVAAGAAALITLEAIIARAWTADGSGGTAATMTGNNNKVRTSHSTSLISGSSGTIRCATTAALTAGTKSLDSQAIGNVTIGLGTGAISTTPNFTLIPKIDLLEVDADGSIHPIVLANQEGFVIRNGASVAWPTLMTWCLGVTVVWAEVSAY